MPIIMKQLIPFALFFFLFSFGAQAQQRVNLKVEDGSILSKDEKVGSYDIVMDTLKIVKFEEFNVDDLIPEMVVSKEVDPTSIKYISESSFLGEGSVRNLEVYIPAPKKTPPAKQNFNMNYSLGRHTDIVGLRVKYYRYFGIEALAGISVHRTDSEKNFMFLGLSNEMNLFYRTGWKGHVALGPLLYAETGVNEMTVTGAASISLRKSTNNWSFGPRLLIGGYNELAFEMALSF
ncbi:MAG: Uncharacterised protein [Flavobacteriaceae bacterium]|nr:MAG: Uncharacterised protein [Flavobacteriaceae bacterium]